MTIPLQNEIVYGPLRSRRFGTSLGINLSTKEKVCNFDCVYCQYGESKIKKSAAYPALSEIEAEFEGCVRRLDGSSIDAITVAGNGEPTLYPAFSKAVDCLIFLRDRFLPGVPIGILSNSSTCHRPEIREALARFDGRYMKLDAGGESMFKAVNRPLSKNVGWNTVLEGLRGLQGITLQSMFIAGPFDNTSDETVGEWVRAVEGIGPKEIQVYTVERSTAYADILPVGKDALKRIAESVTRKTGVPSFVYG